MVANDDAGILNERGVFEFFASKLAPTGSCVFHISIFVCSSLCGRNARA
ncbi:hypothetical protein PMI31_05382 [Pseudomonas sp. GM55]|jgi:hypothetical protein|nr:hypothetical protein PMI31_05382 [Pseudomonas sp. GM55]